jgi:hypothetical protein
LIDQPVEMLVPPRFSAQPRQPPCRGHGRGAQPPDGRRRRTPYPAQARQRAPGRHHVGPNDRRRPRTTPSASSATSPSARPHKTSANGKPLNSGGRMRNWNYSPTMTA